MYRRLWASARKVPESEVVSVVPVIAGPRLLKAPGRSSLPDQVIAVVEAELVAQLHAGAAKVPPLSSLMCSPCNPLSALDCAAGKGRSRRDGPRRV